MIHEQTVRERAYFIWEDEGRVFGRAEAHWLQAEAELNAAQTVLVVEAVAETSVASPAKVLKPTAPRAKAKAEKAPAKAAKKAEEPKAVLKAAAKPRRAPRATEGGIALH